MEAILTRNQRSRLIASFVFAGGGCGGEKVVERRSEERVRYW